MKVSSASARPEETPAARLLASQLSPGVSEYRWQSTAAMNLANLHRIVSDLHECRECLQHMAEQPTDPFSRFFVIAALACYRRASDGEISKVIEASDQVLGARASALHQKLMRLARKLLIHPPTPVREATIGVIVRDNQIVGVSCLPESIDEDALSVPDGIDLVDLVERRIVNPVIERSKAQILNEARTLGIQLVRYLPVVC